MIPERKARCECASCAAIRAFACKALEHSRCLAASQIDFLQWALKTDEYIFPWQRDTCARHRLHFRITFAAIWKTIAPHCSEPEPESFEWHCAEFIQQKAPTLYAELSLCCGDAAELVEREIKCSRRRVASEAALLASGKRLAITLPPDNPSQPTTRVRRA